MTTRQSAPRDSAKLLLALFGLPAIVTLFAAAGSPLSPNLTLAREATMWQLCAFVLWPAGGRVEWARIGLAKPRLAATVGWTLLALAGMAAAMVAAMLLLSLLQVRAGGEASRSLVPLWLTTLTMVRAGVVEEVFYRGYAIEKLSTGWGTFAGVAVSLIAFAASHYRSGVGGVLLALFMGFPLALVYVRSRNLWACIGAHLLVDLIPNVILPLLSGE